MKFYIKQHVFSWGDRFTIYDEAGNDRYYVQGDVFTFGKQLHLCDLLDNELISIEQELFTFRPKYTLNVGNDCIAEVIKEFTLFSNEFTVSGLDWTVSGDFMDHDYDIYDVNGSKICSVEKEWFTWGDAYAIEMVGSVDEVTALAVVIVVDAIMTGNK